MARRQKALLNLGYLLIFAALVWLVIREVRMIPQAFDIGPATGWRAIAAAVLPSLIILAYRLMARRNVLDLIFGYRLITLGFSLLVGYGFMAFLEISEWDHPWPELILGVVLGIWIDLLFFNDGLDRKMVALSGIALYIGGLLHILVFGASWL